MKSITRDWPLLLRLWVDANVAKKCVCRISSAHLVERRVEVICSCENFGLIFGICLRFEREREQIVTRDRETVRLIESSSPRAWAMKYV